MPKCINDNASHYKGTEPSPKGLGYCAHAEKVGTTMQGRYGKIWIVKKYGQKKRWVISDFYKEYKKAENKLRKLLQKSPVTFVFKSSEDAFKKKNYKNWFDEQNLKKRDKIYWPYAATVMLKLTKKGDLIGNIEWKRCACESGFYKYVYSDGHDVGPFTKGKKNPTLEVTYFYNFPKKYTTWKQYKSECKKYHKENIQYIKDNLDKLRKLDAKTKKFIINKYGLDNVRMS